jgi:hypothetical protein
MARVCLPELLLQLKHSIGDTSMAGSSSESLSSLDGAGSVAVLTQAQSMIQVPTDGVTTAQLSINNCQ